MKSRFVLLLFTLIFGIIAVVLFVARYFIDINIIYPISFLSLEILFLIIMKRS